MPPISCLVLRDFGAFNKKIQVLVFQGHVSSINKHSYSTSLMSQSEVHESTNFLNTVNKNVLVFLWLSAHIKNIKMILGSLFLIIVTATAAFSPSPEPVCLYNEVFELDAFKKCSRFYFESMTTVSSTILK